MRWAALVLLAAPRSSAATIAPERVLSEAMAAAQRGAFDEAVDRLESLADGGFVHPDASAGRAYAYVQRARSRSARPGDLGRAVAALEEARWMRPGAVEFESALEKIRAEIARRRARSGSSPLVQTPSLGRAVTGLVPERIWAVLAAIGATLLTAGLALHRFVHRRTAEIAGSVAMVTGALIAVLGATLAARARDYRLSTHPAVVVANEARWLDETGRPLRMQNAQADAIPEGSLVYVHERHSGRSRIEWGSLDGWVDSTQLRNLVLPGRLPL